VGGREQQLVCDLPGATSGLIDRLQAKNVQIDVHTPEKPNQFAGVLGDIAFPLLVIAGLLFFRGAGGGAGGMPGMPQNKAKIVMQPDTGVKFSDVAGIDEAKEELTEVVDFLRAPERFVTWFCWGFIKFLLLMVLLLVLWWFCVIFDFVHF
jgi:cell division protease FtsH